VCVVCVKFPPLVTMRGHIQLRDRVILNDCDTTGVKSRILVYRPTGESVPLQSIHELDMQI